MADLEYEYTFANIPAFDVDRIINELDVLYGDHVTSKYKIVNMSGGHNIKHRLTKTNKSTVYQEKIKLGKAKFNDTYLIVSSEKLLTDTLIKKSLKSNLDDGVYDEFTRHDWLETKISMRISNKTVYVEFEANSDINEQDITHYDNIYRVIYKKIRLPKNVINIGEYQIAKIKRYIKNAVPIQTDERHLHNINVNDFVIRPKTDGVHGFIVPIDGEMYVWFFNKYPILLKNIEPIDYIIEVEFVDVSTIIFIDIFPIEYILDEVCPTTVMKSFVNRYELGIEHLSKYGIIKFRGYKMFKSSKKNLVAAFNKYKNTKMYKKYESDGLIIQSTSIYSDIDFFVYKYKIGDQNTIDMVLETDGFKIIANNKLSLFSGSEEHGYEMGSDVWKKYGDVYGNKVVEWRYDMTLSEFVPMREREDKSDPNYIRTAVSNFDLNFLDIDSFFEGNSYKRVAKILLDIKSLMIDNSMDAYMELGAGSAGLKNRYPRNKLVVMTEYANREIIEAKKRITKDIRMDKRNIIMLQLNYLHIDKGLNIFNNYLVYAPSVQITDFITITHQTRDEIPQLNKMWAAYLNLSNVRKISIMAINGGEMIEMHNNHELEKIGINITKTDIQDQYNTSIGKTTTSSFTEYLYDIDLYFENLDSFGVSWRKQKVSDYIDWNIDYLNDIEMKWLNLHYVYTLVLKNEQYFDNSDSDYDTEDDPEDNMVDDALHL